MRTEPLSLAHRDLLEGRFRRLSLPFSECTFAGTYLFRASHRYEVLFPDGEVFLRGRSGDGKTFLMPTSDLRDQNPDSLACLLAGADFFYPVPADWLARFPPGTFSAVEKEEDADYVYSMERMATLAGRSLHKKRNLLAQFTRAYRHEARPLLPKNLPDALAVLDGWQTESGQEPGETDYAACREALTRGEELALCGGIYYADGKPAGFALGEELDPGTFVLHFAKGLTRFKGIYQYVFNTFARVLPPMYRFLNLEQDLGRETLRGAKESWEPDRMLLKYRLGLR